MADFSFQTLGDNKFALSGVIDFTTVPLLLEQTSDLMHDGEAATIDLANVTRANSAAMALLIEWKSVAAQHNTDVSYLNIPVQISRLADVCGVEFLLLS